MTQAQRIQHRGPWARNRPDGPPSCPGCGGRLDFSQPDRRRAGELLGTCDNLPACGEWVIVARRENRWMILDRIPRERRDPNNPAWTPARPAGPETAARVARG
jgi:hypothetical protein